MLAELDNGAVQFHLRQQNDMIAHIYVLESDRSNESVLHIESPSHDSSGILLVLRLSQGQGTEQYLSIHKVRRRNMARKLWRALASISSSFSCSRRLAVSSSLR